jgi:hypothetical protein
MHAKHACVHTHYACIHACKFVWNKAPAPDPAAPAPSPLPCRLAWLKHKIVEPTTVPAKMAPSTMPVRKGQESCTCTFVAHLGQHAVQ